MELSREERLALVPDTLVGSVIHIDEKWLPLLWQSAVVNCKTVIL